MERNSFLIVAKAILSDKRLSITARLLMAQLLDHRNNRTGQCNPKRKTLAQALGMDTGKDKGSRRMTRALAELRKAGLISSKQGQHGSFYELRVDKNVHPERVQGGQKCPVSLDKNVQPGLPYPLYEPYFKEPSGFAASSPQKTKPQNTPLRKSAQSETLRCYYEQQRRKEAAK